MARLDSRLRAGAASRITRVDSPFLAETVLGRALRGIGRERYVLATKVGRYGDDSFDFSATHPASRDVLARCAQAAAACRDRGVSLTKLALQFAVPTSPCLTTVFGSASAAQLQRDVGWIDEPLDEDLLAMVDGILRPVRDRGWISGRQENQNPGKGS